MPFHHKNINILALVINQVKEYQFVTLENRQKICKLVVYSAHAVYIQKVFIE